MPAWWGKKGSRKKEETPSPKSDTARGKRPITRLSDDYGLTRNSPRVSRDLGSGSTGFCGFDSDDRKGHPLPLPRVNDHGINGVGSVSSVSSHGSCCEDQIIGIDQHLGQFGGYRSPVDHRGRREIKFTTESRGLDARSRSPGPSSGNHGLGSKAPGSPSLLPLHQLLGTTSLDSPVGGSEEVKSQWHPLPLPPSSPTSPKLCTRSNGSVENPLPLPPSSPTSPKRCTRSTGSVENLRVMPSKWKKGRLLGRGTFGHVYLGFNCERGQMCAIKEVRNVSDDQTAKECLKQLNQEINLLSQLSHPNIVRYYGSELSEETLSVYLEYVSGGSINKLLQQYGAFGEPVIQNYTRQILSGLVYLHGRNTMHRDIKGANILVDPNGEIKLADFGMAKHITAYTSMLSFKGSPYWMAPEVVMNANGYSSLVDIWSLGCTILEMATSKPPWSQYEGVAAIFKVGNSKDMPYIPDHLSSDAKDFIRLCLQREPSLRPTAVKLLEHPFVKDQATTRVANISVTRGAFPRTFDGCQTPPALDLHSDRTSTTVGEVDYLARPTFTNSRASRIPRDDVQGITSLPVSPCSSPLRQRRSAQRNFFHSPPHPAYILAGQSNYNINDHPSTSITQNTTYAHNPYLDFPLLKGQTPAASSRTRLI